jgi:hypothetical protein
MASNRLVSWTAFALFAIAVGVAAMLVFAPVLAQFGFILSDGALWVIGALALVSAVLGFFGFKTPQGRLAAVGGVLLLFAVLFVIPTSMTITG